MHAIPRQLFLTVAAAVVIFAGISRAAENALPFVSPIFGDHMVMQRDKPATIWGWTEAGSEVRLSVDGGESRTVSGDDGRWSIRFDPPPAGGPYIISLEGPERRELRDVLVGDVWLCTGQSNMVVGLDRTSDSDDAIARADRPGIRLFTVKNQAAYTPASLTEGSWKICTPETATSFSAVGYHFGRRLHEELDVAIGLVQCAVGGTAAETWASAEALRPLRDFDAQLDEVSRLRKPGGPEYGNFISHWYDEHDRGQKEGWFSADLDDSGWETVAVPGGFEELGVPDTPALAYFRKTIVVPDDASLEGARLQLGVVERMDTAHLNGRWIGASAWVENPRNYAIPDGALRKGPNQLVVRVFKTQPDGGFRSPPEALKIVLSDRSEISLAGEWRGRVSVDAGPPHPLPAAFENWPVIPSVLYNGMIAPLAPMSLSGAIWYQGEANVGRAEQYRTLLPAMIADWRRTFGQGDVPFYIVSLAAYMQRRDTPGGDGGWAEFRDAQAHVARTVANSGLALTIDKGDASDIHPRDKREVGERLALCALDGHYGKDVVSSGPVLRSALPTQSGDGLRLEFDRAEGGLVTRGDALGEFSVAADDMKWAWAEASIEGRSVIVSSPDVPRPKFVRYAWQSNPMATLYNKAGLPAVPFRTDGSPRTEGSPEKP